MCMISVVSDDASRRWARDFDWAQGFTVPQVTKSEFDALRNEVAELKKLLLQAKEYDRATGQPDCEMEDKIAMLRKMAEFVGVDLSEVFRPAANSVSLPHVRSVADRAGAIT